MKSKRPDPRTLRRRIESVEVKSLANGRMLVIPKYQKKGCRPGVFTRMYVASTLSKILNHQLRGPSK